MKVLKSRMGGKRVLEERGYCISLIELRNWKVGKSRSQLVRIILCMFFLVLQSCNF